MNSQQVTIELPELILRRLTLLANATHQSVEALISQSMLSNLPPSTEIAPPELQQEFLRMPNPECRDPSADRSGLSGSHPI